MAKRMESAKRKTKKDIGSMPGYQSDALLKIIGSGKIVVEIGSYRGVTARKLALAGNNVLCIEPFKGGYDASKVSKELLKENTVKKDFLKNTKGLSRIVLNENYSYKVIDNFRDELHRVFVDRVDVLIIDGEHTYEGVKKDIEWIEFVEIGGIIAFHDYGLKQFPGIKKAVELAKEAGANAIKFQLYKTLR